MYGDYGSYGQIKAIKGKYDQIMVNIGSEAKYGPKWYIGDK